MPMVVRSSPRMQEEAARRNIGKGKEEGAPRPVTMVGAGHQGGNLIAFTEGARIAHGR